MCTCSGRSAAQRGGGASGFRAVISGGAVDNRAGVPCEVLLDKVLPSGHVARPTVTFSEWFNCFLEVARRVDPAGSVVESGLESTALYTPTLATDRLEVRTSLEVSEVVVDESEAIVTRVNEALPVRGTRRRVKQRQQQERPQATP